MAKGSFPQGPNFIHPEKPSAVGSRNSLNRSNRDEYMEGKLVIDEEVDKILNHITAKLPPEVLERLNVQGSIKELLHNYFNQGYHNMFNRYLTTVEDEMGKKFRDLLDREEYQKLNKYTPREIADLLGKIGGNEKFNTGEIERSVVNIYGHTQGHIQRGVYDLEQLTNNILRQKIDVGAFVRGENTYAVVKCSFADSLEKPETVANIKLVINILEEELISPIYHYQVVSEAIIKDVVANHIHVLIDREVNKINESLMDEGKTTLSDNETIFEKMKDLENYFDFGTDHTPEAKQFSFVALQFYESLQGISAEIDRAEFDALNFRENVKKIIDNENLRNRGYNTAINALTSILDTSRMGYQHIENLKNARSLVIREYEDVEVVTLPDEYYTIKFGFLDDQQLRELRASYVQQLDEFNYEVEKLWNVIEKLYQNEKSDQGFMDFQDVLSNYSSQNEESKGGWFGGGSGDSIVEEEEVERLWDEITFIQPNPTEMEALNETFRVKRTKISKKFILLADRLNQIYGTKNPAERVIVDRRLNFLERSFINFNHSYNPYHVQPGVLLEVSISTIKRKQTTMNGMSNVLNEFLAGISKGFADAAFAGYSRRRSTERSDLDQAFKSTDGKGVEEEEEVAGVADLD